MCDQGDLHSIDAFIGEVVNAHGRIDIRPKIRVNCIALGPTITENFRSFVLPKNDPTGSKYFDTVPMKRGGEQEEVGRVCVFLASGPADFVNGTTIEADGGMLPGVLYDAGLETITDLL